MSGIVKKRHNLFEGRIPITAHDIYGDLPEDDIGDGGTALQDALAAQRDAAISLNFPPARANLFNHSTKPLQTESTSYESLDITDAIPVLSPPSKLVKHSPIFSENQLSAKKKSRKSGASKRKNSTEVKASRAASRVSLCSTPMSDFVESLKPLLHLNQSTTKVLQYFLGLSHDQGSDECYIIMPALADAVGMTVRNCQKIISKLQTQRLILRLSDYDPRNPIGSKFKVYLFETTSNPLPALLKPLK